MKVPPRILRHQGRARDVQAQEPASPQPTRRDPQPAPARSAVSSETLFRALQDSIEDERHHARAATLTTFFLLLFLVLVVAAAGFFGGKWMFSREAERQADIEKSLEAFRSKTDRALQQIGVDLEQFWKQQNANPTNPAGASPEVTDALNRQATDLHTLRQLLAEMRERQAALDRGMVDQEAARVALVQRVDALADAMKMPPAPSAARMASPSPAPPPSVSIAIRPAGGVTSFTWRVPLPE